ncbi:MAG: isochorismate synthase [Polyangiaceae bacterium]|nr:isochorismate synthase [Polyangiaceae bacterium]
MTTLGSELSLPRGPVPALVLRSVPLVAPHTLLELDDSDAFAFENDDGQSFAGLGRAFAFEASGPERAAQLEHWLERTERSFAPAPLELPLAYGALSFCPLLAQDETWRGFHAAELVIPRVLYRALGDRGELCVIDPGGDSDRARAHAGQIAAWLAERRAPSDRTCVISGSDEAASQARFGRVAAELLALIRAGGAQKIVAARKVTLHLERPPRPAQLLRTLGARHPTATRFCLRREGACFIGASPELLVERRGRLVRSDAVAGSAPNTPARRAALLDSVKDRREHELVVEAIEQVLAARCAQLSVPAEPKVRPSGTVAHLATELCGVLSSPPAHLLSLVDALHPTPALGGTPREAALRHIAQHEGFERGLYGAPLGFVDRHGSGRFVVALRSMVLRGKDATLFAGAGLIADSTVAQEVEETSWKLRTLADALAATGAGGEPTR